MSYSCFTTVRFPSTYLLTCLQEREMKVLFGQLLQNSNERTGQASPKEWRRNRTAMTALTKSSCQLKSFSGIVIKLLLHKNVNERTGHCLTPQSFRRLRTFSGTAFSQKCQWTNRLVMTDQFSIFWLWKTPKREQLNVSTKRTVRSLPVQRDNLILLL